MVLSHFFQKGSLFRFSLREIRPARLLPLSRDGLPRAVCMLCRGVLPVLLNALIIRLVGDGGVTALSAMTSTSFVVASLGWGIGGAVLIMGGMAAGEQDVTALKDVVHTALRDILGGVVCLAALVFALAPLIASLFISQAGETRVMALWAIRCYALCLPFLAFNVSAANYFQAVARNLEANVVNIGIEVACTAGTAWSLSRLLGVRGVWIAFPAGAALLSLLILLRLLLLLDPSRPWPEACMALRPDFGVREEDRLERSLHSMEEVVALSQEVYALCAAHGIGQREAHRLALCIEELAGNVIEHGFSDGRPHHMELRVLVKDGIVLRLRDDCRRFDFREKAESWSFDPAQPEKNIGIRMVMRVAADIVYTNTMNTNNLIVRL